MKIADGTGDVQRDKLRIDARIWYASKLHPKKYGAKPEVPTVNVGVGVAVNVVTEEKRAEFIEQKRRATELLRMQGNRV